MAPVKAYPKYKDSGVPWFGEVPSHWQTPRLGAILKERKETNKSNDVTKILSVMKDRGVIPYEEKGKVGNKCSEDITRYKIVRPDDIVANCMNIVIGSVGLSKYTGCLSPVYYVLMPRSQEDDSRFFDYVFKIKSFQLSLVRLGNGIMAHRMRIPMELLKCETVPKPPIDEQKVIVEYLDVVNKIIRRYIREKQKVIMLLSEQKQALIDHALGYGVKQNIRLKSSGFDWLGKIPEGWKIKRLKYLVQNCNDQTLSKAKDEIYIALDQIESWTGRVSFPESELIFESHVKRFRSGDILFCKLRPYLAKVTRPSKGGVCVGELLVLRPRSSDLLPDFVEQKLRSSHVITMVNSSTFGAKMPRADWSFVGNLLIQYPESIEEQSGILDYIKKNTEKLTVAIDQIQNEIKLIREYCTRIISDVVTGKIDVRDIKLPAIEDVTNSDPIEDQETLEDVEDTEEVVNVYE
jgi:type I restriction enzyme, S subunit